MKLLKLLVFLIFIGIVGTLIFSGVNGEDENENESQKLAWPLPEGKKREKKLTFGLFVTPDPEINPIDPPERFTGYHTALDLEILPEEESQEVPVLAACEGKVLQVETVAGYGGVIIQSCRIENQETTVLYGHLDYKRFQKNVGDEVKTGEQLGFLGDEKSAETGNTRKHLHFGIHRGPEIEVRGYVENEAALQEYIDPLPLLER